MNHSRNVIEVCFVISTNQPLAPSGHVGWLLLIRDIMWMKIGSNAHLGLAETNLRGMTAEEVD